MNTIRELTEQEKYNTMLKRKNREIKTLRQENAQIGMLNADLSIYLKEHKARIDKAIRILNSAKNHYDNDKTNWAIERTLRALKGSNTNE